MKKYKTDFENSSTKLGKIMNAGKAMAVANEFNGVPKVILLEGNVKPETREFLNEAARKSGVTLLVGDLNGATEGQFAIETLPDGRKYVQADRQIIHSEDPDNWGADIENYINTEIRNGKDVEITTTDGEKLKITADTAWKIADREEWTDKQYLTKMNAGAHIDEVAEVSKLTGHDGLTKDRSNKRFKADSFDYRTAYFRDYDGKYYLLGISVGLDKKGKTVYNIGIIRKRRFPTGLGSSSNNGGAQNVEKPSNGMIPQNEAIVKYSTKDDSDGKTQLQIALENAGIDSSIFENGGNDAQLSIENGKGIKSGAFYVDKNIIAIDWRSEPAQITEAVTLHEMTHSAESSKYFGEYKEFVKAQLGEDFEKQTREIAKYYKDNGKMLKRSEAEAEVVANYTRHNLLTDKVAIQKFIKSDYGTARLFADGARDIINKVKSAFGIETVSKVENGIRYLERALATRGTNSLTSAAAVQYNITDNSIINEDAILDTLHSLKGMPGVKYQNGASIKIPNTDIEVLRRTLAENEKNGTATEGILDFAQCKGHGGKKNYFYVFYKSDDGMVAPIFRADLKYSYEETIRNIKNEMGYKNGNDSQSKGTYYGVDRIRNIGQGISSNVNDATNGASTDGIGKTYSEPSGFGQESNGLDDTGISDGVIKGSGDRQSGGRGSRSYSIENLSPEQVEAVKNMEEGEASDGKKGENSGGVSGVSSEHRNSRGSDTENKRNISVTDSEVENGEIGTIGNEYREDGKESNGNSLGRSVQSAAFEIQTSWEKTDGRRFYDALKNGDEKTARKLLNEQAERNGFETANMYHGTHAEDVFTEFKNDGQAHWVSTNKEYSDRYADGYFGNDTKAEQLYTDKESGIYELYIKKGKVLDIGKIEEIIETPDELKEFADSIGFTVKELMPAFSKSRKNYKENREKWTITCTPEFADLARKHGYDSLKATEGKNNIETYGILYSENIKSSKLVTYDDNGKIIPLEERFNTSKNDIRYSIENLSPEQVEAIKKAEESGDKVSEFYKNSLQKEVVTPAVKAEDAPERHKYKPISNEETYKNARAYVEAAGFDKAKAVLKNLKSRRYLRLLIINYLRYFLHFQWKKKP